MTDTWFQVLTIVLANAGISISMFLWIRSEANSDRRDICTLIREIQIESKDFHGRLCAIEERNKGK